MSRVMVPVDDLCVCGVWRPEDRVALAVGPRCCCCWGEVAHRIAESLILPIDRVRLCSDRLKVKLREGDKYLDPG